MRKESEWRAGQIEVHAKVAYRSDDLPSCGKACF